MRLIALGGGKRGGHEKRSKYIRGERKERGQISENK